MIKILKMCSVNMFRVLFFLLILPFFLAVPTAGSVCNDTVPDCGTYKHEDICTGVSKMYGAVYCRKTCGHCNDCRQPPALENGIVTLKESTTYNSTATYSCHKGYDLFGDNQTVCQANSSWSGLNRMCVIKDCGSPTAPSNGFVNLSGGTTYGSKAVYICATGYTLYGNNTAVCDATGNWFDHYVNCTVNDCRQPPTLENGKVTLNKSTTYNSTATYSCNIGYDLHGDNHTVCQANSSWSGLNRACVIRDCGNPTAPSNGFVNLSGGTTYGSKAVYICATGYTLYGSNTSVCEATGNWSDNYVNCTINDCGDPGAPVNGTTDKQDGTKFQAVITYECDTGFDMIGHRTAVCQSNKTWSNDRPTCRIKDCGNLKAPTNGFVITPQGSTFGSRASYTCKTGYTLYGNDISLCVATGNWNNQNANCTINDCSDPTSPDNGSFIKPNGTTYQAVITYFCNEGYILTGATTTVCQANESWSAGPPKCVIRDCGDPGTPVNGTAENQNGTKYQAVITYKCDTGFDMVGHGTAVCQSNETWSNDRPTCMIKDCGKPNQPTRGNVSLDSGQRTVYLHNATYVCNSGYETNDPTHVTCNASGRWSNMPPTCIDIDECKRYTAKCHKWAKCENTEGSYTCSCNKGFKDTSDNTGRQCEDINECVPGNKCNPNGSLCVNYPGGFRCECNDGWTGETCYEAEVSTASSECKDTVPDCETYKKNGLCSEELYGALICRKTCGHCKDCGILTAPANGFVDMSEGSSFGSKARYSCNFGYTLYGNDTTVCEATGKWRDQHVNCTINDCGYPRAPENGNVTVIGSTTYKSIATFNCNKGYDLHGDIYTACQANGIWSGLNRMCVIKNCGLPSVPKNGNVTVLGNTSYKSTAMFSCNIGYDLHGDIHTVCQANGRWSGLNRTCVIKDCGQPPALKHGSITVKGSTTYNSKAMYSCHEGYDLHGDNHTVCQANRIWSGFDRTCVIRDCGQPPALENGNVTLIESTTYNSKAMYSCHKGYDLHGDSHTVCQANSSWSEPNRTCVIRAPQKSVMCFGCEDMSSPQYCDSVLHCKSNEVCFLESDLLGHGTIFRSGCMDEKTCHFMQSSNTGSVCVECCNSDFCNSRGCGNTDFPAREQRGPVCFDCHHTGDPNACDTVTMCTSNQVCSIEKFQWGDSFHYKQGCSHPVCNSLSRRRRSIPICHSCCNEDFCNQNCSSNAIDNSGIFVG